MVSSAEEFVRHLHEKRSRWVRETKENDIWEGLRQTLGRFYPDEAHFIYELLQNAEDAQASKVEFTLRQNELVCAHDGQRLFTSDDVDSVTNIGKSAKRDELNQIGKFGVGFKAVFAYTSRPQIFSGDFAFEIQDLCVPSWLDQNPAHGGETRFEFPFDNPEKNPRTCFREAADWLNRITDNLILFLRNIHSISWEIEGENSGSITRRQAIDDIVEVEYLGTGKRESVRSNWLLFSEPYKQAETGVHSLSVAFKLDRTKVGPKRQGRESRSGLRIVPMEERGGAAGQISIYFPAEKETTGLRFHIHGPYASTVARDSIPHRSDNQQLLLRTAKLLVNSLPKVRDLGWLTRDFVAVLPNADDGLSEFYRPMLDEVVKAMKRRPLVPAAGGTHGSAADLLSGPEPIRKVIGDDGLAFFTERPNAKWVIGVMQGSRADSFIKTLGIGEWGWDELCGAVKRQFAAESGAATQWLEGKSDAWMQAFYGLLHELMEETYEEEGARAWRVVRTSKGEHVVGTGVFFPMDSGGSEGTALPCVKPSLLQGRKGKQTGNTHKFLERVGVREMDEKARIEILLKTYYTHDSKRPEWKLHIEHMKRFVSWWTESKDASVFGESFIFCEASGKCWRKPVEAYVDRPFRRTGLTSLFSSGILENDRRYPLSSRYKRARIEKFIEFAVAAGVIDQLQIVDIHSKWGTSNYRELRNTFHGARENESFHFADYTIQNLEKLLTLRDKDISRLVWGTMRNVDPEVLRAVYRPNQSHECRATDSQLVLKLKEHNWIPAGDGQFHRASELIRDDLPDGFSYDDRNGWLTAIGFGIEHWRRQEAVKQQRAAAEMLGLSPEFAEEIAALTQEERERCRPQLIETVRRLREESRVRQALMSRPSGEPGPKERPAQIAKRESTKSSPVQTLDVAKAFRDVFNQPGKTELLISHFDSDPVRDPGGRRRRIREEYASAQQQEASGEDRVRAMLVDVWDPKNNAVRDFFIGEYGGQCQICLHTFPKHDGQPYFEGVYLIPHSEAAWTDRPGSVLCLCAECSAKFRHGVKECDDVVQQIMALKTAKEGGGGGLCIRIMLIGEEKLIRFSERHLLDVQELIKSSNP